MSSSSEDDTEYEEEGKISEAEEDDEDEIEERAKNELLWESEPFSRRVKFNISRSNTL